MTGQPSLPFRRSMIFDIGMHAGEDTEFYLKKGYWVVAVDANPLLADKARERFAEAIAEGRLRIENVGIGDAPGEFDFYVSNNPVFSSFERDLGSRNGLQEVIRVRMVTLGSLFEKYGVPYYLKVDIEGNDGVTFDALDGVAQRPRYVSVENGFVWMLDRLRTLGYDAFKFVNQAEVAKQTLPRPAREGREVEHRFAFGSSGAFGDEAPGEWKDYEAVRAEVETYWGRPDRDANIHGWYDLHARHAAPA